MNSIPKFCGKCGAPLELKTLFCGKCGAAIAQASDHTPQKVQASSVNPPADNDSFLSKNAMTSAW